MGRKGWHDRGYLPHLDGHGIVQHVVFRLRDALPPDLAADGDDALDSGAGACSLRDPENAWYVAQALLHFDGERYGLRAWCVMPNHVHVLLETLPAYELGAVVRAWKTYTARRINARLGHNGPFWAADYFDRYMRDESQYIATQRYIEMNPVKAGLCAHPEDWPFSSAGWKS